MDRLERLVNLVVALLDTPRPLTKEELRQRVGGYSDDDANFHRNFERDKDLLRQMGIPVVAEPLGGSDISERLTGYRVPRDLYELPDPGLDEDELLALSLAVSAVAFDGSAKGAATTALWKLAAVSAQRSGASEPGGLPLADVPADDKVATLFSGVQQRRVARFEYNGLPRRVDPYRLSYRQGRWYLAGFDHGREGERLFRVDRITGAVGLEEAMGQFVRPQGVVSGPPPPWRLGDDEEIVVELRVDASQAEWVRSLAGEETVAGTSPDGGADFKLPVTNRAAFRGFVLGLLDRAEVMGPPEVRDEIVYWLSDLAGPNLAGPNLAGPIWPGQEARCEGRYHHGRPSPVSRAKRPGPACEPPKRSGAARAVVEHCAVGRGPGRADRGRDLRTLRHIERDLIADLNLLFLCGVYPYTPDALIEVDIDGGRVWVRFADWFRRPLRLTPPEGLALVAAARALLGVPGPGLPDERGALASAVSKLEMVLGAGGEEALEVELGAASAEVLSTFQLACSEHRKVVVDYYSFGRDEVGERVVRPWRMFSSGGHWYLLAWCEKVADRRLFRVDRVRSAALLEASFDPPEDLGPIAVYESRPDDPLVVLDLGPELSG